MRVAGIGAIILGYALLYAGLSNLSTGGKGTGFLTSLGMTNAPTIGFNVQSFVSSIVPGGTTSTVSTQPAPTQNSSPVSGVIQT